MEINDRQQIKSIIESLMIVSAEPLTLDEINKTLSEKWKIPPQEIQAMIEELKTEYIQQKKGYQITEIAEKYQLCTHSENADWVRKYLQVKNAEGLSKPSLETLAIIAYRQPITKIEIEGIRGVNVDGVLKKLTDKGLIKTKGKKDILGHPFLYATTEKFLEYFGLRSLSDLPQKEELLNLQQRPADSKNEVESNNIGTHEETPEITAENRPD